MNEKEHIQSHAPLSENLVRLLTNLCRFILGIVFVFSGYVKAIDPLGTQYKIKDYLEAIGLLGAVPDWATLSTSILLSTIEFAMGIFILFAIRRRLTSIFILVFMIVMTLISLWLATFNPIKDCGCFGDAIKLTNLQTLFKNIILLSCAIVVWRWPLMMSRFITKPNQWLAINYVFLFIIISSIWSLWNLPVFDFRPYHIGANIKKGMEIPKGAPQPVFKSTFVLEKNGQRKEFTLDNYPDSTWKFIDSKTVMIKEGFVPSIHDFSIEDMKTEEDLTQQILNNKGYTFLLIAPHLEQADDSNFGDIDKIYEYAQDHHYPFYCLTTSDNKAILRWQNITGAEYPFYTTDETTLKTIIRSNPGLVLIKNATIIRKWSHNDLPKLDDTTRPLNEIKIGHLPQDTISGKILKILLWFILPLLLLSIANHFWTLSTLVRKKIKEKKQKIKDGLTEEEGKIKKGNEMIIESSNKIISTFKKKRK